MLSLLKEAKKVERKVDAFFTTTDRLSEGWGQHPVFCSDFVKNVLGSR